MVDAAEFPLHKGAKGSFIFVGVLLCLLVLTVPLAIWVFFRVGRGKVVVSRSGVEAAGIMLTDRFEFSDVARLGILTVPLAGAGIGRVVANIKLGGLGYGLNVVVQTRAGKTIKFIANQYERHEELIERIKKAVPLPCETIQMGLVSMKWPERSA